MDDSIWKIFGSRWPGQFACFMRPFACINILFMARFLSSCCMPYCISQLAFFSLSTYLLALFLPLALLLPPLALLLSSPFRVLFFWRSNHVVLVCARRTLLCQILVVSSQWATSSRMQGTCVTPVWHFSSRVLSYSSRNVPARLCRIYKERRGQIKGLRVL